MKKDEKTIYKLLKYHIIDSDDIIKKKIGKNSIGYTHPYGIFDNRVMDVVKEKYKLVYTTNKGPNVYETDPLYLRRYVIDIYSNVEDFFDYELLPIIKTEPENGGYVKNGNEISFYFESENELNSFRNFSFLLNKKKLRVKIDNKRVYLRLSKNIEVKTFPLSLIAEDKYGNKYIETITVNLEKH